MCLFGDLYPCRTFVRRHFVPRHFFRTGRLTCANKFAVCATSRGPFFLYKSQMDVKAFFFFVLVFGSYPCRTFVRRHFVPRHFFRTGRLTCANKFAVCATTRGSVLSLQEPNECENVLFLCLFGDLYPCRTVVRRHYMPRHFF